MWDFHLICEIAFVAGLLFLIYIWIGYPMLLAVLQLCAKEKDFNYSEQYHPTVSILIAAHNEATNLEGRIQNIYHSDYPAHLIEVVIASDGSTDGTEDVMQQLSSCFPNIKLVKVFPQAGRANAHNIAVRECAGNILIFSDAETLFDRQFISKVVAPFSDKNIGFVSGTLIYSNTNKNIVTRSAGLYWRFEMLLRQSESAVGLYIQGTGACSAMRKHLFRPIPLTGDIDFAAPLDTVFQNHGCLHVSDAYAYDNMPDTQQREFNARVRMTAKDFFGILTHWGARGLLHHPLYSFALLSHKFGRWLTPFAMVDILAANLFLLSRGILYDISLISQLCFYGLGVIGFYKIPLPLAGTVYSFCLANIGFAFGIIKALTGHVPAAYRPTNKIV